MPKKNSINGIHAQRLKSIRSFVNFDFDLRKPLSRYQKQKIKTYYDEIEKLTNRPNQIYRPRRNDHLKKAQLYAQHEKELPGLKVAFIPLTASHKLKIRFDKNDNLLVAGDYADHYFIPLDPLALIDNPVDYVNDTIAEFKRADRYSIAAGAFEIPSSVGYNNIAEEVARYVAKYTSPEYQHGPKSNHYVTNWLIGLNAAKLKNQSSIDDYTNARNDARAERERQRTARKSRKKAIMRIKGLIREYKRSKSKTLLSRIKKLCKKWNCLNLIEGL